MAQVLIRDMDERTLQLIKARARSKGHSMQKELKMLLEQAVQLPSADPTGTLFPPVTAASVKGVPASKLLIQDRR